MNELTLESLRKENFGWHELPGGEHIRSNEFPGNVDDIVYHKDQTTLDSYYGVFEHFTPESVLEIGVMEGGSLVLWNALFGCKVVGIDNTAVNMTPAFRRYQRKETCDVGKQDIVVAFLDVNNIPRLEAVVKREFPEGIDLIIDDGPHVLNIMRNSFRALWPKVRKGGMYSIEDWKALHPIHREDLLSFLGLTVSDGVIEKHHNFILIHKNMTGN